jgi:hypothetical protein
MICNTISLDPFQPNAIKFDSLLENASSNVLSWISGDELTNLTDIINIASAYLARRDYVKLPLRFSELVEISVLKLSS